MILDLKEAEANRESRIKNEKCFAADASIPAARGSSLESTIGIQREIWEIKEKT